jgi:hypothetical protein
MPRECCDGFVESRSRARREQSRPLEIACRPGSPIPTLELLTGKALGGESAQQSASRRSGTACGRATTKVEPFKLPCRQADSKGRPSRLIDDVLDVSRIISGKLALNLGPVSLAEASRTRSRPSRRRLRPSAFASSPKWTRPLRSPLTVTGCNRSYGTYCRTP